MYCSGRKRQQKMTQMDGMIIIVTAPFVSSRSPSHGAQGKPGLEDLERPERLMIAAALNMLSYVRVGCQHVPASLSWQSIVQHLNFELERHGDTATGMPVIQNISESRVAGFGPDNSGT